MLQIIWSDMMRVFAQSPARNFRNILYEMSMFNVSMNAYNFFKNVPHSFEEVPVLQSESEMQGYLI